MRNVGDKIVSQEIINKYKNMFRNLKEWTVNYIEEENKLYEDTFWTNGQCVLGDKKADIYPCPADVDIEEYVIHEMIHIALAATKSREEEENLVQDLCVIIAGKNNG